MLTLEQAAKRIGITPEALTRSRQRGMPPGNLAVMFEGEPVWEESDLLPIKRSRKELLEAALAAGLKPRAKATVAELEELLEGG